MKQKYKIYLDTSIINFIYADDTPFLRDITIDLFDNYISKQIYEFYISPIVINEILKTKDERRKQTLLDVITKYNLRSLTLKNHVEEIDYLANKYIEKRVIPKKKREDALHIAICIILKIDILLSWNYQHLANIKSENKILVVNLEEGYHHSLRIITPFEVMIDEKK